MANILLITISSILEAHRKQRDLLAKDSHSSAQCRSVSIMVCLGGIACEAGAAGARRGESARSRNAHTVCMAAKISIILPPVMILVPVLVSSQSVRLCTSKAKLHSSDVQY